MEKGGQKGTHRVPSGSIGVVFEEGMRWEWVEGAWVCISVKHAVLTMVFSLFCHSVRSCYSNGKVTEAAGTFFSLLQLVIDTLHSFIYFLFIHIYISSFHMLLPLFMLMTNSFISVPLNHSF